MVDEKELLKALVCRANDPIVDCAECPYYVDSFAGSCDYQRICRDALALLKEQEPRVMTFEELYVDSDESVICYIEFCDKDAINVTAPFRYPGDNLIQIPYIGTEWREWAELKQYGKTWRCWTSRPSEQQMRDTKWEADNETV